MNSIACMGLWDAKSDWFTDPSCMGEFYTHGQLQDIVQGEGMDLHGIPQAHVCNTVHAVTKSELFHLASRVQWEECSCKLLGMQTVYYQSCIQNLEWKW